MVVGRVRELAVAAAAIERGAPVVVEGPFGIGKSALIEALRPGMVGARVGRGLPALRSRPYLALTMALGDRFAGHEPAAAARVVDEQLPGGHALIIEDAHWCDPCTLEVLAQLARSRPLVLSVQSGAEGAGAAREACASPDAEQLQLGPLHDDAIELLLARAGPEYLGRVERRAIVSAAHGVPLVALWLAATIDHLRDERPAEAVDLELQIRAMFGRLGSDERLALGLLAQLGVPLDPVELEQRVARSLVERGLCRFDGGGRVELAHPELFTSNRFLRLCPVDQQRVSTRAAELTSIGSPTGGLGPPRVAHGREVGCAATPTEQLHTDPARTDGAHREQTHSEQAPSVLTRAEPRQPQQNDGEFDATRNLVMLWTAIGRHAEAQALARDAQRSAGELDEAVWAVEFRTLEMLSQVNDCTAHDEAIAWMSSVRTAPLRLQTRLMATVALATMVADRGAFDRSASVLQQWMEPERLESLDPLSCAMVVWAEVQRSWLAGELTEAIRLARWLHERVPASTPSLAGTQVVWRWAELESGRELSAPDPTGGLLDAARVEADGIAGLASGEHERAFERFVEAADLWQPILRRCSLRARWAAGHALVLSGRHDEGAPLLEALDGELDLHGCTALRPRLVASLRRAGRSPRSGAAVSRAGRLTARETAVLELVARGYSSAEIARRLSISVETVNSHVRTAKRKVGARSRIEAVARAGLTG